MNTLLKKTTVTAVTAAIDGQVNFRRDGKGTDFFIDPTSLYKKAYEVNGNSLNYSECLDYYVRVTAVFDDGASPISYATTIQIPLEPLPQFSEEEMSLIESELIENKFLKSLYSIIFIKNY